MTRTQLQIANSSLLSCLSYSSNAILASHWSKLKFVRQLIGYVKSREHRLELSLQRHTIKANIHFNSIKLCSHKAVHIKLIKTNLLFWKLRDRQVSSVFVFRVRLLFTYVFLFFFLSNDLSQVFGLGNKTYEHYNKVAIYVDKRLEELGANRVFELGLGDDDAK